MLRKKTMMVTKTKITKKRIRVKVTKWLVEPCYQRLGLAIVEQRVTHGLRQEDLAKKLNISRAALANMEAGRQRIYLHHVFAIEKTFGVYNSLLNIARGRNTA